MGSFYMTGHSGVITDGQECVLFYVVNVDSVYGQFKPISGPLHCKYTDYGTYSLEEKSKETFEDFANYIKPRLVEFELGENQYHDIAVNSGLFNWDFAFDMLHETRFEIETCYDKRKTPVKAFVVHKAYYDSIMESYNLQATKEFLDKDINERLEKYNSLSDEKFEKMSFRFRSDGNFNRRIRKMEAEEYIGEFWTETFTRDDEENFGIIPQYRKDYLAEAYCFNSFIRNASLDYFPSNYAGQQRPRKEMLMHIKALEQTMIAEFMEDIEDNIYNIVCDENSEEETEAIIDMVKQSIKYEKASSIMENKLFANLFNRYCGVEE